MLNHNCTFCGRAIERKQKYCSTSCYKLAWKHYWIKMMKRK